MADAPSIAPAPSAPAKRRSSKRRKAAAAETSVTKAAPAAPAKRRGKRRGGAVSRRGDFMGRSGLQQKVVAAGGALVGQAVLGGKTFNGIPQTLIASIALDYFAGDNAMAHDASTGMFVAGSMEWMALNAIRAGQEAFAKWIAPLVGAVAQEGGTAGTNAQAIAAANGIKLTATSGTDGDTDFDARVQRLAGRHANGG